MSCICAVFVCAPGRVHIGVRCNRFVLWSALLYLCPAVCSCLCLIASGGHSVCYAVTCDRSVVGGDQIRQYRARAVLPSRCFVVWVLLLWIVGSFLKDCVCLSVWTVCLTVSASELWLGVLCRMWCHLPTRLFVLCGNHWWLDNMAIACVLWAHFGALEFSQVDWVIPLGGF